MSILYGYTIFNGTIEEITEKIISTEEKIHIVSGNPEVLYNGLNNKFTYNNFLSKNTIIIPDGIGVVKLLRLINHKVHKIPGIDVFKKLMNNLDKQTSVYFLGSNNDVLNQFIKNIEQDYKNIKIAGYHHGYIDIDNCDDIIHDIKSKSPTAIFVAMGSPKQEMFIAKYMDELPCKIFMGVGGTFDVLSGNVKRAPQWIIDINLEWLYRIVKEPKRIKRFKKNIRFVAMSIKEIYIDSRRNKELIKKSI